MGAIVGAIHYQCLTGHHSLYMVILPKHWRYFDLVNQCPPNVKPGYFEIFNFYFFPGLHNIII